MHGTLPASVRTAGTQSPDGGACPRRAGLHSSRRASIRPLASTWCVVAQREERSPNNVSTGPLGRESCRDGVSKLISRNNTVPKPAQPKTPVACRVGACLRWRVKIPKWLWKALCGEKTENRRASSDPKNHCGGPQGRYPQCRQPRPVRPSQQLRLLQRPSQTRRRVQLARMTQVHSRRVLPPRLQSR